MFKSARKFTLAATLFALTVPMGHAFAQSTTKPTPPTPSGITGTDPEPLGITGTDPEPIGMAISMLMALSAA